MRVYFELLTELFGSLYPLATPRKQYTDTHKHQIVYSVKTDFSYNLFMNQ